MAERMAASKKLIMGTKLVTKKYNAIAVRVTNVKGCCENRNNSKLSCVKKARYLTTEKEIKVVTNFLLSLYSKGEKLFCLLNFFETTCNIFSMFKLDSTSRKISAAPNLF